jgi:hypothetical protein
MVISCSLGETPHHLIACHCEKRSDEAIPGIPEIATALPRDDSFAEHPWKAALARLKVSLQTHS